MLVLTRKPGEQILIGDDIKIFITDIQGNKVRIGIDAPRSVKIVRHELQVEQVGKQTDVSVSLPGFPDQ